MTQTAQLNTWVYVGESNKVQIYKNDPKRIVIWGVLPYCPDGPIQAQIKYQLSPNEWRYDPQAKSYVPLTKENQDRVGHFALDGRSRLYYDVLRVLKRITGFPKKPTVEEVAEALRTIPLLYRVESAANGSGKWYVTKIARPGGWVSVKG